MMGAYKETVYSRHNRVVADMDFQQLKIVCTRPAQTQASKIPAWGGGGLEVPELRSYWQLITIGIGRVSFL